METSGWETWTPSGLDSSLAPLRFPSRDWGRLCLARKFEDCRRGSQVHPWELESKTTKGSKFSSPNYLELGLHNHPLPPEKQLQNLEANISRTWWGVTLEPLSLTLSLIISRLLQGWRCQSRIWQPCSDRPTISTKILGKLRKPYIHAQSSGGCSNFKHREQVLAAFS